MQHSSGSPCQQKVSCVLTQATLNQPRLRIHVLAMREAIHKTLIRVLCATSDKQCIRHSCATCPTSLEQLMHVMPSTHRHAEPSSALSSSSITGGVA